MLRYRIIAGAATALLCTVGVSRAGAQQQGGVQLHPLGDTTAAVDWPAAVVGNRPILHSQVEEELFTRISGGMPAPQTPEEQVAARRDLLQQLIESELLVQEAQRDTTIKVTDEEVAEAVDQQLKQIRSRLPSEQDFRAELQKSGFQTADEFRRWLGDQQRRQLYQSRLVEKLKGTGALKPVAPTEQELRDYFERTRGQGQTRPATVGFRQIVVSPAPSAAAKARARALADSIVAELRKGADFALAARRFSQDPGSKEQGGELGWFRRGRMVPSFERAAFALRPGQVSDPVETTYGYHIIQVERVQPAEIQARHILIIPEVTQADQDSARARADQIAAALRAGASFDSLQRLYHDPDEQRTASDTPVPELPEGYKPLAEADSGQIVGPLPLATPAGKQKFSVMQVTQRRPEGPAVFADVRDRLREQLSQQLAIRRYLDRLRQATYIAVRDPALREQHSTDGS